MSQEIIDSLNAKVEELNKKLQQVQAQNDALIAQLDASKQMFNESLNSCLQWRTQSNVFAKMLVDKDKDIERLKSELVTVHAKVLQLMNPPKSDNEESKSVNPEVEKAA